jgi:iron complex outermembrane receptor protein
LLKPALEKKMVWETAAGNQQNGYSLFSVSNKYRDLGFRITVEDAQSGGFAPDTDYKKFTASASTLWEFAQGDWENNFGYQEKEFGAYDFYTPGLGYPSREWTRTYLLNSGFSFNRDGLLVKPNFLWRRHFDKFALNQNLLDYNDHRNDMFVSGIYLQKEIGLLGRAGLGLEWGRDAITSTSLGKHSRQHKSVFFDESRQFGEKLEIGLGLRWDDYSDADPEYSGSADFKFKLNSAVSFNLGISRNVRVPSFTELYYNDVRTIGNPDLSAERAWNYQAGFKYQQEDFSTGLVLFLRRENQMIDWVGTDPLEKWQAKNFTSDKVFGAEYSLHKKFNSLLSLDAHYTYTEKVIDNQGYLYKYGPNYARHLVNTVFNLDLPFGRQEIGFNYKKRPGRRGWLLLDAGLSYNLNKNSKIFLSSKNLLNVEYQDIAGIPQSGRYLQAGLRFDW